MTATRAKLAPIANPTDSEGRDGRRRQHRERLQSLCVGHLLIQAPPSSLNHHRVSPGLERRGLPDGDHCLKSHEPRVTVIAPPPSLTPSLFCLAFGVSLSSSGPFHCSPQVGQVAQPVSKEDFSIQIHVCVDVSRLLCCTETHPESHSTLEGHHLAVTILAA